MKSFMSAALQDTTAPTGATECNTCNGGVVRTTGQESNGPTPAAPDNKQPQATSPTQEPSSVPEKEKAVVVMQGPLGTAITEALNKSLAKSAVQSPIQLPTSANESFALNYVQANGQINNPKTFVAKVNKAVGLVPATDEAPTVINTLLDCASKVDDIEFIMVGKVDESPSESQVPQKSVIQAYNEDGTPAMEEYAIESVQVVVTYRQLRKE